MPALFSQANRQGDVTTPSYTVPTDASGEYEFLVELSAQEQGSNKSFSLTIEVDFGQGWRPWAGIFWQGPTIEVPSMRLLAHELAGYPVRVHMVIPIRMRLGISVQPWIEPPEEPET